jgi:putrescine importer
VTFVGGVVFIVVSHLAYNAWPDYMSFKDPESGSMEIIKLVGGNFLVTMFLIGQIGCFGSAMAAQASGARVLYAMGRDGQLLKKFFGYLHPKFKTPVYNIMLIGVISLTALFVSLTLASSFINFGAYLAFIFVNLSVIAHYYIRNKKRSFKGTILYLILPLLGAITCTILLIKLDVHSLLLGGVWLIFGVIYLIFLTKGFRKGLPEIREGIEM